MSKNCNIDCEDDDDDNDNDDDNYDDADDNDTTVSVAADDDDYRGDDNDEGFSSSIIYSLDKLAIKTFQLQHPLLYFGYLLT